MKYKCDVTEADIERFCGPWSVSRRNVEILIADGWQPNETVERMLWQRVRKYLASAKAFVAECEVKLPDYDELQFWREAVKFWELVASTRDYPEPVETPKQRPPQNAFERLANVFTRR